LPAIRQEDVAVTFRSRYLLSAVVGVCLAHPLTAQEPARLNVDPGPALSAQPQVSLNQKIANTIAEHLRQSGQLRRYTIDVAVHNGSAELTGTVADQTQRDEALRIVMGVPGVERVVDHLTVTGVGTLTPVQAGGGVQPKPGGGGDVPPPAGGGVMPVPQPGGGGVVPKPGGGVFPPPPMPETPSTPVKPDAPPVSTIPNGTVPGPIGEPAPIHQFAGVGPYDVNQPHMPPYAWPTYAPYNNYSRVAYPEAYPYNAWPFIGPVYPFPKIPLGWRSVKLEWEDGHWWFRRVATSHDWWRLRYW
jgi:hypothetical protein